MQGRLILENGEIFEGTIIGRSRRGYGEVVFHTGMTGYQEILTDPSYTGQIVVMTYPLIGNYGINPADFESRKPWLSGFVTAEACEEPSHWQSKQTLSDYLAEQDIVGLTGVDTRSIVRMIRDKGAMKGWILPVTGNESVEAGDLEFPETEQGKVDLVTTPVVYEVSATGNYHVVVMDFGVKTNILRSLVQMGCRVTVVPAGTSFEVIRDLRPDGILLSNGPGDPLDCAEILPVIRKLAETYPVMGICLGHQLLSLAFGAQTGKMLFGHRGSNHPVKDLTTGRIWITSQNHGYAVLGDHIPAALEVTHVNVNDGTIEGVRVKGLPAFSVQFHPEACPGPRDSEELFERFLQFMAQQEERHLAYAT
ncbi:carbamoyl phosphate synthase small subunit [Effusibacillus lacus]|uniref:Carbamoyl phosphate synthase small chain n=1 Tax=Effusibacillus lacus TaxID=1348429 RepID=A0A292YIF0_9BACL|nr:carbamoyl phosphate synthase small subunit [Effusibacillus lacus]TCS74166.1 carbamoyl-phosphate synthase small subunit [Effusibacillus lacus]GAX90837.1 carbamoyl phosphate synthase small subunit [Effusibacillus lacus]